MRFRGVSVRSMVLMTALACGACGGSAASQPATGSSASAPASASASAPASTVASTDFGVAECDDYFKKYLACIDKLAPAAQTQARQALDQSRAAWKQAASTEQGKAALATTCKSASDTIAASMRAQGCTW
jgi:hypothetical protein